MQIIKVISSKIEAARRFVKFTLMGQKDVQEVNQVSPYGIDSTPIEGHTGIYSTTATIGENLVIGYINNNQVTESGEISIYSTDDNGVEQIRFHLKKDGTAELGGNSDFLMRFNNTAAVVKELQDKFQDLQTIIAVTWVPVPSDGGLAFQTAALPWATAPLVGDIDQSKIDELKTS